MVKTHSTILLIEDSEDDRALIEYTINSAGIKAEILHSDNREEIQKILSENPPSMVISDYNLPGLDGIEVLTMVRKMTQDIPFILISGTVGEDVAVKAVLAGADDYIMKDNLNRLPTTIEREFRNYKLAHAKREADLKAREAESRLASLIESTPGAIWSIDSEGRLTAFNQKFRQLVKLYSNNEINAGDKFREFLTDEFADRYDEVVSAARTGKPQNLMTAIPLQNGSETFLDINVNPVLNNGKVNDITFLANDITGKKNVERDLDLFFNQTLDIICTITLEGEIRNINPAFERTLEYSKSEIIGKKLGDFIHPDDEESEEDSDENPGHFIKRYVSKSGKIRWLSWKAVPIKKRNLIYAIARDITDQKEKEKKILEYAERQRTILESITDAMIVADQDDRIVFMNSVAEEQLQVKRIDLIGSRLSENFEMLENSTFRKKFELSKQSGNPDEFEEYFDTLEKWFRVNLYPSNDGCSIYFHDITTARLANEKVKKSQQQFKQLFENSLEGILITTEDGVITETNRSASSILGYSRDQLIGKNRSLILDASREKVESILESRKKQGYYHGKVNFRHANERLIPVEFTSTEFYDLSGKKQIGYIFRDISVRMNVENKLKESLKEKEVMLAEIHHRVKNNLAIISGLLMLQGERVDPSMSEIFMESIQRIKSMALIHEMMYHSDTFAYLNFADYAEKLGKSIADNYDEKRKDIELEFKLPEPVYLDINRAIPSGLIINELMINAYKHAFTEQDSGKILVDIRMKGDTCIIEISDNGKGLSKGFTAGNMSTLGFTLITGLTDQIDGDLSIENQNGAKFIISFVVD